MENYVTLEQAKKLKELGFDWESNHYYRLDASIHKQTKSDYFNFNHIPYLISAPTLSQAQKWLYNHFGLWIEVFYEVKKKSFEYTIFNKSDNTKKSFFNPWVKIIYDTPTKAFLAGIDKALELLKL